MTYLADYLNALTVGTERTEVRAALAGQGPIQVLHNSAVQSSVTGTVSETTLRTVTIPTGTMAANDVLHIRHFWTCTNSANNKQFIIKLNGTAGTAFYNVGQTAITINTGQTIIANRNATNSQVGLNSGNTNGFNTSTSTLVTSAIDMTASVDLLFRAQLTNTGETISLEYSCVELIRAPI